MMTSAHEALATAIAHERAAWQAVEAHLPGTPGFEPQHWQAWLEAVKRADQARAALAQARGTFTSSSSSSPRDRA